MTKEEHELMIAMFAAMYEGIQQIFDTLKSKDLWTGDDPQAFAAAVHADTDKTFRIMRRTQERYLYLAAQLGVDTGISDRRV